MAAEALELAATCMSPTRRPAIFMDRDGTLSHEVGYVNHPSRFRLYPWTVDAVRAINRAGWLAVVVTNQAGVARGYFPESVLRRGAAAAARRASRRAARASTRVYACLHHPSVGAPPYRTRLRLPQAAAGDAARAPRRSSGPTSRARG